jgi:hypothetical protein
MTAGTLCAIENDAMALRLDDFLGSSALLAHNALVAAVKQCVTMSPSFICARISGNGKSLSGICTISAAPVSVANPGASDSRFREACAGVTMGFGVAIVVLSCPLGFPNAGSL